MLFLALVLLLTASPPPSTHTHNPHAAGASETPSETLITLYLLVMTTHNQADVFVSVVIILTQPKYCFEWSSVLHQYLAPPLCGKETSSSVL